MGRMHQADIRRIRVVIPMVLTIALMAWTVHVISEWPKVCLQGRTMMVARLQTCRRGGLVEEVLVILSRLNILQPSRRAGFSQLLWV